MNPRELAEARALAAQAWAVYQRAWDQAAVAGHTPASAAQLRRFAGERAVRAYITTRVSGGRYTEAQYQTAFAEIRRAVGAARDTTSRAGNRPHPASQGGVSLTPFTGDPGSTYAYVIGYTVRLPGRGGRTVGGHVTVYSDVPLSQDQMLGRGRQAAYDDAQSRYGDYPGVRARGDVPIPDVEVRAIWRMP